MKLLENFDKFNEFNINSDEQLRMVRGGGIEVSFTESNTTITCDDGPETHDDRTVHDVCITH